MADTTTEEVICGNCGETTADDHLFGDICLRVTADQLPAFERTDRADWEGR